MSGKGGVSPLVVVLGAGASRGVRENAGLKPPLGANLGTYLQRWLNENDPENDPSAEYLLAASDPLTQYLKSTFYGNEESLILKETLDSLVAQEAAHPAFGKAPFEGLMDSLIVEDGKGRGSRLDLLLTLLACSMLFGRSAFAEGVDLYDKLVAGWLGRRPTVIVTLNYDILIEDAVRRLGRSYCHPEIPGVDGKSFESGNGVDSVLVYKLHGSVNWWTLSYGGGSANLEVALTTSKPVTVLDRGPIVAAQTYATGVDPDPDRKNLVSSLWGDPGFGVPVVAMYGTGKQLPWNPEHIENHRKSCIREIHSLEAADVLIAGVRLASQEDDPTLVELIDVLNRKVGKKVYVSPDSEDCARFENRGYTAHKQTIREWLETTGGA